MILHSTGGSAPKVTFAEATSFGVAPDGGLYIPDSFPRLPMALFRNISDMSLREIAYVIGDCLLRDELGSEAVKRIVDEAINYDIPLHRLSDNQYVAEMWHGPTLSFKDLGARIMANIIKEIDKNSSTGRDIILATSGDSGGAVADAFRHAQDTKVFVLYPRKGLSREQVARFASMANVVAMEVEGSFDDCQALVKAALESRLSRKGRLMTAGNSINVARLLPAITNVFHIYARVREMAGDKGDIVMAVPCGNLGSICASLMAKRMGLPVKRFIAANNANDVFVEYLRSGGFTPQKTLMTLARAMDVGNPSNMARIIDLYGGDLNALRHDVAGYACSDDEIAGTIRSLNADHGYLIDPQGATALCGCSALLQTGEIGVALATAHPTKSVKAMEQILGHPLEISSALDEIRSMPLRVMKIPPTLGALQRVMNMN